MTAANEALSTDTPATVTFDTLKAAQELRKTGFEDRQAEAIVSTISKAMSETVATKADLELQGAATRAEIDALGAATRAEIEATRAAIDALRGDTKAEIDATRAAIDALRGDTKAEIDALGAAIELLRADMNANMKLQEQSMATLQDKIVIKLGALMVTMTFLLLAIGPFYLRWVLALLGPVE